MFCNEPRVTDRHVHELEASHSHLFFASMANDSAVAFCFVGQFIRHATLTRDVRRFGAARYHAFVASSLQHEEERTGDVVDSVAL